MLKPLLRAILVSVLGMFIAVCGTASGEVNAPPTPEGKVFKKEFLRRFSPACVLLRTLGIPAIQHFPSVTQNCAVLQQNSFEP
jgi:hypothetical protein